MAVEPRTDEPGRRFADGQVLRAESGGRTFTVTSSRDHSGRLLVCFAELADRTAVEAVRGTVLLVDVPADEMPEEPEEYYDRQLVGLTALTTDGATIGAVTAVVHMPGQDLLELRTEHGVRLVPFVEALVPEVDLTAGTVVVDAPEGLLDPDADA